MRHRGLCVRLLAAGLLAAPGIVGAQVSGTWVNPSGGNWSDGWNWSSNPLYPTAGGVATFPSNDAVMSINLNTNAQLSELHFGSIPKLALSGSGSLTLSGPSVIDVAGFGSISSSVRLVGTEGLTKTGSGTLWTSNSGSLSGVIRALGGTLRIWDVTTAIHLDNASLILGYASPGSTIEIGPGGGSLLADQSLQYKGGIIGSGTVLFGSSNASVGFNSVHVACTYTGPTVVLGHELRLTEAGALLNTSAVEVMGRVVVEPADVGQSNRINDTAEIHLNGGTIEVQNLYGERLGNVVVDTSRSMIKYAEIGQLSRSERRGTLSARYVKINGSVPLIGGGGGTNSTSISILPYAVDTEATQLLPMTVMGQRIRSLYSNEFVATLSVSSGTLNVRNGGQLITGANVANSYTINAGSLSGAGSLAVQSGAVYFEGAASIESPLHFGSAEGILFAANTGTISSAISGSNGLTIGSGSIVLSGASDYTGPTVVNGDLTVLGDVLAGQPGPLGLDDSPLVLNGAAAKGRLFIGGSEPVVWDRDIVASTPGYGFTSIFVSSLHPVPVELRGDIDVTSRLSLGGGSFGSMHVSGRISGGNTSYATSVWTASMYVSGSVTLSGDNTISGTIYTGSTTSLLSLGSDSALGSAALWHRFGAIQAISGPRTFANLWQIEDSSIAGSDPITFTGPVWLGGPSIMGTGTINVGSTSLLTITGPLVGTRLNKTGAGTIQFARLRVPQLAVIAGAAKVLPSGTADATGKVSELSISAGAFLDLSDNDLIVDYTGTTVLPSIRAMLLDQRLRSSLADSTHALGYADNGLLGRPAFGGLPVDATAVLIQYTFVGDTNLDGMVDIADLGNLATNWQSSNAWTGGDLNYDGFVDITDLGLLATNWQAGVGNPGSWAFADALASLGLPNVTIPEPATGTVLLGLLPWLATRRRERLGGK